MVISDTVLLLIFIAIWIVTFVLIWAVRNKFIAGVGGVIGLILGIRVMTGVDQLLGLVIVVVGFYQLYLAAFTEDKKK